MSDSSRHGTPSVRKGQINVTLNETAFKERARKIFGHADPAATDKIVEHLWKTYDSSTKWPDKVALGPDFGNPSFEFGSDWLATYRQLVIAKEAHHDAGAPTRYLLINGSPRNDQTCPSEMSKTHRLCEAARSVLAASGEVDTLDLSRITSEYGKRIHPCKSCVATAMPLCHWPCSCYPNHALGQVQDWMNEIYPMWMRAHGILIVTPVHWYSPPSVLKLMMDRLVCADGGNPDPSSTDGKDAKKAKELELAGWKYPKHLSGRRFSLVVHGDAEGALDVKEAIANWLTDMGLEVAATIDRYIGYYEPYATSHDSLDHDTALFDEVRRVAQALVTSTREYRSRLTNESQARPGLTRAQWSSGSESFGADTDVRPK